jgi:hypothetical protein
VFEVDILATFGSIGAGSRLGATLSEAGLWCCLAAGVTSNWCGIWKTRRTRLEVEPHQPAHVSMCVIDGPHCYAGCGKWGEITLHSV